MIAFQNTPQQLITILGLLLRMQRPDRYVKPVSQLHIAQQSVPQRVLQIADCPLCDVHTSNLTL